MMLAFERKLQVKAHRGSEAEADRMCHPVGGYIIYYRNLREVESEWYVASCEVAPRQSENRLEAMSGDAGRCLRHDVANSWLNL